VLTIFSRAKKSTRRNPVVLYILFLSLLPLLALSFSLFTPATTQAHPPLGFTNTPTATPGPVAPTPTPTPSPDDPDPDPDPDPPEVVEVALSCSLTCSLDGPALTVSFPIQIVHNGSGWIAEGTLSNSGSTSFSVPYAGEWRVYMTGPPQSNYPENISFPSSYPVLLGTVQANSGAQTVDCPITCDVLEPVPDLLPTTGAQESQIVAISPLTILSLLILFAVVANGIAEFLHRRAAVRSKEVGD
jgi:hypothetical protein